MTNISLLANVSITALIISVGERNSCSDDTTSEDYIEIEYGDSSHVCSGVRGTLLPLWEVTPDGDDVIIRLVSKNSSKTYRGFLLQYNGE